MKRMNMEEPTFSLPSEWALQSGVQLTWPHAETDWCDMLDEVEECFLQIAKAITLFEKLLVVTPEPERVAKLLEKEIDLEQVTFFECPTNDTWARDHGALTCIGSDGLHLLDFCFNGWGLKFAANYDNQITHELFTAGVLKGTYHDCRNFVFEGGSIESDGAGTLLTTAECLLSVNRNVTMTREQIEAYLLSLFGAKQMLWLNHGYLSGDDTDSHVDTLARLCPNDTIAYVQCLDEADEHFEELAQMEEELMAFRTLNGRPYRLLPLPMAREVVFNGERLPATYANFLIINGAVLVPTYATDRDALALKQIEVAFPEHKVIGVDCRALIKQHGSLHCVTMQFPEGVL